MISIQKMSLHHKEKHNADLLFLRDVVIGLADGLTVPFALAAGLSAALSSNSVIVIAGIAEIVAGSISMGLGGYLAGKTEVEHYDGELRREYREIEEIPEEEKDEVRVALGEYGLSQATKELVVKELSQAKDHWANFMMRFELGLEEPDRRRPSRSALTVGGSYAVGGIVPLLPYVFTQTPSQGLAYSTVFTGVALAIFGYAKSQLTSQPALKGAFYMLLTGGLAAAAAFLIAKLVRL